MHVLRITYHPKVGRAGDLIDLIKSGSEEFGLPEEPHSVRVFWPYISPHDTLTVEMEFESLVEQEVYFHRW